MKYSGWVCLLAGLTGLDWLANANPPAGYIGAAACGKCHPEQFASQSRSGHAGALYRALDHPLAKQFTSAAEWKREPSFVFVFAKRTDGFFVQAFDYATRQTLELPVEWAFGTGNHAVTFVSEVSADVYIEHAFSFFTDSMTMGLTPGHRLMQADTLAKAAGVLYKVDDPRGGIRNCFSCHSTGPIRNTAHGLEPEEPGIRCEVCHGPGGVHQKAAVAGNLRQARETIQNPARMSADKINEFCGACHRYPGENFAVNWNANWNVRHQPPYLRQSRCFLESRGRLSCFTCHGPHEALRKGDPTYYARKCVGCHSKSASQPAKLCRLQRTGNCVACHMPTVAVTSHLRFVNHWIGIYKDGANLKPVSRERR